MVAPAGIHAGPPKLVRDKIPEITAAKGQVARYRVAAAEEIRGLAAAKLREEVAEYAEAAANGRDWDALTELADVLEVVYFCAGLSGATAADLEHVRVEKDKERGGFGKHVVWLGE